MIVTPLVRAQITPDLVDSFKATSLVSILLPMQNQADQFAGIVSDYEDALTELGVPHRLLLIVNGWSDGTARFNTDRYRPSAKVDRQWPFISPHSASPTTR